MKTTVKCSRCGKHNEVSRLFCTNCGAKLEFDKIRLGKSPFSLLTFFQRLVRWGLFLGLCALLVLLLWAPDLSGEVGDEVEARAAFDKLADLYELIQMNARGARVISEREANAYLEELIQEAVPPLQGSALQLQLAAINVQFHDDRVVVQVNAGWRGITIAQVISGVPSVDRDQFELDVQRVQFGRVPLPGLLGARTAQRILPVFESMEREREVLDNLTEIAVREGALRLSVGEVPVQ